MSLDAAHFTPVCGMPQELIDYIVDYLHDDHPTLRSCALVSQSWLPTSRRHLFTKIALKATSPQNGLAVPQERCQRLHKLLLRVPSIIPLIRELEICEGSPLHHYNSDVQGSTTWVTTERSLAALFRMLTHVQRLDFAATSTLYWSLLPPTFQKALCRLLALPSLTYVRLHSWMFPNFGALKRMLGGCRSLRAFALSSTNVSNMVDVDEPLSVSGPEVVHNNSEADQDNDNANEDSDGQLVARESTSTSHTQIPLEVLTLDFVTFAHLEHWLLGKDPTFQVDIRHLRELRVAHFHDAHTVEKLLRTVGPSLESFHLKPGTWEVHSFDLSQNSGLRAIRLTLDDPKTAMNWATTILSSLASPQSTNSSSTSLTSIGLEFYTDPKKLSGWSHLADLFLISPLSTTLKQIEIGLFAIPGGADFSAVKEEMRGLDLGGASGGRGVVVRWYQLGVRSSKSRRELTPRICLYES